LYEFYSNAVNLCGQKEMLYSVA